MSVRAFAKPTLAIAVRWPRVAQMGRSFVTFDAEAKMQTITQRPTKACNFAAAERHDFPAWPRRDSKAHREWVFGKVGNCFGGTTTLRQSRRALKAVRTINKPSEAPKVQPNDAIFALQGWG